VTDRIIAMLAQGGHVAHARWVAAASRGFPRNLHTGRCYRGANVLLLWDEAIAQGHATNFWMTYRQAAMLGGQVRRGARGVMCAHFDRVPGRPARDEAQAGAAGKGALCGVDEGEGLGSARVGVLRCRPLWLFNLAQVDGLPDDLGMAACEGAPAAGEGRGAVETALRLVAGCDAVVRHGFGVASYVPVRDEIRLPLPKRFASAENYCATLLHELVHWTGHPARLHRAFGPRFGDAAHAFEALVAELAKDDEYQCPAGERAIYRFSTLEKNGLNAHVYWTSACPTCSIKDQCTTGDYRRIRRWEHEEVLERVQQRLDKKPEAMTLRRRTVEHVFGTLKHWMGSTHFLTKTLAHVGTEMSLHVLAYNLKRVIAILGMRKTMKAVRLVGREPLYGASTTRRGPAGLQIRSCPSTATGWPARLPVAIAMRMLGILERRRRFHTASAANSVL
jgi:antirestriction protein ArdC